MISILHKRVGFITSQKFPFSKRTCAIYVQGQSPQPRVREYFYYIDHQGMVFSFYYISKLKLLIAELAFYK